MRKTYLLAAAAAAMFAACSSDKIETGQAPVQPDVTTVQNSAIAFDAYTQRATSRAGQAAPMILGNLQKSRDEKGGFGVFGYYTDNNEYDPLAIPNFMYNQGVFYDGSTWKYDPVKYWPNEYGSNAISDDADKVSFFAYAPYVDVVPSTGKIAGSADEAKWGITGMSRNSSSGDPLVKYIVSFDQDKMVDLCWGVCDDPTWKTVAGEVQAINGGQTGLPWLDVKRPAEATTLSSATDSKLKFQFKHALAQLNVQVDYDADDDAHNETNTLAADITRVYVRSITFTGFATKGALNLNNTEANKALWLDYNGTADLESGEEVTIYDGRKDGKEGASGAIASNEKTLGLNPNFVQDEEWAAGNEHKGVDKTAANLFRKWDGANSKYIPMAATDPVYVIPTGEDFTVTIVYDVETVDGNLATYVSDAKTPGSSIENSISKTVSFGTSSVMENGKKYTLKLHLGLNSVKFDADVDGWTEVTPGTETWLPSNKTTFNASGNYGYTVRAVTTSSQAFDLTGFAPGESITAAVDGTVVTAPATVSSADANGVVSGVTMTIIDNKTVKDVTTAAALTLTGNTSGRKITIDLTQIALAPNYSGAATSAASTITFTSGSTATGDTWFSATPADVNVKILSAKRNGVAMEATTSAPTTLTQYQVTADKTITLSGNPTVGETFVFVIQAGDAPAETVIVNIAS